MKQHDNSFHSICISQNKRGYDLQFDWNISLKNNKLFLKNINDVIFFLCQHFELISELDVINIETIPHLPTGKTIRRTSNDSNNPL